jgi:hypothetical protein
MNFITRETMDRAVRSSTSNPILEPPRPQRVVPRQDRVRPISRVAQLHRRSEENIPIIEAQREEERPQSECRPSYTSQNHHFPSFTQRSSSNSSHFPVSPLHQTVIPAFHPNHYDLSSSNVCLCIPLTIKTPLHRWRQRRRSVKELRARDDELRKEYARLKQIESQFRGGLPPYEEVQKECIQVRNEGLERPRPQTAAVPNHVQHQERAIGAM